MSRQINDVIVAFAAAAEPRVQAGYVHIGDEPWADVAVLVDAFPLGDPTEVGDGR